MTKTKPSGPVDLVTPTIKKGNLLKDRPAESAVLLAALPLYDWLHVTVGLSPALAAIIALVVASIPLAISAYVDSRTEPGDPGDDDAEGGPPTETGSHEKLGLRNEGI